VPGLETHFQHIKHVRELKQQKKTVEFETVGGIHKKAGASRCTQSAWSIEHGVDFSVTIGLV